MSRSDSPKTTHALLSDIVKRTSYRPDWRVGLNHDRDTDVVALEILSLGYDTHHEDLGQTYRVIHSFMVPPATYNEQSWTRWVLDRFIDVEIHEACEFFRVDGRQPFPPNHGPGWDPYGVRELNRVQDAETTFRGERREGTQGL
jgi:hypothetical protein